MQGWADRLDFHSIFVPVFDQLRFGDLNLLHRRGDNSIPPPFYLFAGGSNGFVFRPFSCQFLQSSNQFILSGDRSSDHVAEDLIIIVFLKFHGNIDLTVFHLLILDIDSLDIIGLQIQTVFGHIFHKPHTHEHFPALL